MRRSDSGFVSGSSAGDCKANDGYQGGHQGVTDREDVEVFAEVNTNFAGGAIGPYATRRESDVSSSEASNGNDEQRLAENKRKTEGDADAAAEDGSQEAEVDDGESKSQKYKKVAGQLVIIDTYLTRYPISDSSFSPSPAVTLSSQLHSAG